jgi:23S rRNA (adenine2030-N6)-methyltransferase
MNHHFGKIGDIWKHLPLAEILQLNPPSHYWETHAGSASYPLTETAARRHGVFNFVERAPADAELEACSYLRALQDLPGVFPGSPLLAIRALGQRASYLFCDIDPQSATSLRNEVAHLDARVVEGDGPTAVAAEAQLGRVEPGDVLVLIDPFFPNERFTPESPTSVELAALLALAGYRIMFWYAYFELEERGWARRAVAELAPGVELWCGDTIMPISFTYPERSGLFGCGIVLANATAAEQETCHRLGLALERISGNDIVPGNDPPYLTYQRIR